MVGDVSSGSPLCFLPGSFRDRHARVLCNSGEVFRALSAEALLRWRALAAAPCFAAMQRDGRVVATEEVPAPEGAPEQGWAGWLRHERVPVPSWPGEWCFSMLRDAARLQLELLSEALTDGLVLQDGTPYNVQFRGARAVFVDVASFVPYEPGAPWEGQRQFSELCLNPLLLTAWRGVPFQPWLRGSLEGLSARDLSGMLGWRDRLRPTALVHVVLAAALQRRGAPATRQLRGELAAAGMGVEVLTSLTRRLRRVLDGLSFRPPRSAFSHYDREHGYDAGDAAAKGAFVEAVAGARPRSLVLDLGANTGTFARRAARHAELVVALDADHAAVERLYLALRDEGCATILPLVVDLADPSPARGWRGAERASLFERVAPDLSLALALVHHLSIGANVPLEEVVDWLVSLGPELVVEWVDREDPLVQRMLAGKSARHDDYRREVFEQALFARAELRGRRELQGGRRVLYHAARRPGAGGAPR